MDRKKEIKDKLKVLRESKNANTQSIINGLKGVPTCLVFCELLPITTEDMYEGVKGLKDSGEIILKYPLEPLNIKDSIFHNIILN